MAKKKSSAASKAAKSNPKPGKIAEIYLSVLGYKEDGQWVAIALEMDLRGRGTSFDKAAEDLLDLVRMQVSFALSKNQPELILRSADPIWFAKFAEVRSERLHSMLSEGVEDSPFQIAGLPIPPPHIIADLKFNPA